MKIPNTACSGCNQLLDLGYVLDDNPKLVSVGICRHCAKEYPTRYCLICKIRTVHLGTLYRACSECIIDKQFNLENEFEKANRLLMKALGFYASHTDAMQKEVDELLFYFDTLERLGYDKKHYFDDPNQHVQNSNQGIIVEQPGDRPEENK